MNLPQGALDYFSQELAHSTQSPRSFFKAWKCGVEIAGAAWFGDGTSDGLTRAASKWDLQPNVLMIGKALGVLSSGERMFLAAMVSFYNARKGSRDAQTMWL